MSTKANTPIKLKRLVLSSILYLIWASIGAVVAIVLNLPAQFGGSSSGLLSRISSMAWAQHWARRSGGWFHMRC
jgi:hypothetical protein